MNQWKAVSLGEICDKIGDGLHGTPMYDNSGEFFFINGNNLVDGNIVIKKDTKRVVESEYLKHKKELNDRTLFVSINGTLGNVAEYRNEPCILGKSVCYLNIKNDVVKDYIKYVLYSPNFQFHIAHTSTGTTIKNVSLKIMREYKFLLPPVELQKQIAKILVSIDDKIELNNQINDNLAA